MIDPAFDWDDANIEHLAAHGVDPGEAEDALLDPDRLVTPSFGEGESRWVGIGSTEDGRVLTVVFTRRGELARIITAWDATTREKRRYRRGRK
jgi:uncharacterized protein